MKTIPYSSNAFREIMSKYVNNVSQTPENEFCGSIINDLDNYIAEVLYDVNIKSIVSTHIDELFYKYGDYINKKLMKDISFLDKKYAEKLGEGFLTDLFSQHLYTNTMICS